jgi:TolB-like protein
VADQFSKEITIAVLPFQVLTDFERLNPIMLGFTEDLITNISKFVGLSVISHLTTQHIQGSNTKDLIEKLGIDYLVSGSLRSQGEKVRVNIQLTKTEDDSIVFAGYHLETSEAIFNAEDAVTHQIVNVLQQQIDQDLLSYSYRKKNTNLDAYVNWLKGMQVMYKGTPESDLEARNYFNKALQIDPTYARAYSGISLSYFNEWSCQLWDRWEVSSKGAQEFALKALELDENDYQALMVLGRTYIFTEEFEKAEHYLRKSLRMNPNDAKNLMYIAFLIIYLGYAEEALKLYNKANKLNPIGQDKFLVYGVFIHFELGDFEKAISIGKKIKVDESWIDFPIFMAAAYYHLNDFENAQKYWNIFLEKFKTHIIRDKQPTEIEAVEWHININPYKGKTNLKEFWNYILKGKPKKLDDKKEWKLNQEASIFMQKGEMWHLSFLGQSTILKDAKGFHDLSKLLSNPNKEFHCMEMMGSNMSENVTEIVIDQKAKADYEKKIKRLLIQIEDAQEFNNTEQIEKLQMEYNTLLDHLSASLGMGRKPRAKGSSVEKARSAITWRIRNVIKKIKTSHPKLAMHLSRSINTGTFCSYHPEVHIDWEL